MTEKVKLDATVSDVEALRRIAEFLRLAAHPGAAAAESIADRLEGYLRGQIA